MKRRAVNDGALLRKNKMKDVAYRLGTVWRNTVDDFRFYKLRKEGRGKLSKTELGIRP